MVQCRTLDIKSVFKQDKTEIYVCTFIRIYNFFTIFQSHIFSAFFKNKKKKRIGTKSTFHSILLYVHYS